MAHHPPPLDVAQLVAEHHAALYRFAYRLAGSAADAEDLTQQTFLVAQQKLGQVRDAACARSWLFSVLRNAYYRVHRRRLPAANGDFDLAIDNIPEELPDDGRIDEERLQAAINDLPEEFRMVLVMFYFQEHSYREIASELNVPLGTVMSRLSRAKGHLRSRLFEIEFHALGGRSHGTTNPRG